MRKGLMMILPFSLRVYITVEGVRYPENAREKDDAESSYNYHLSLLLLFELLPAEASLRKEGCAAAFPCPFLATIYTPTFIFPAFFILINYSYPKYDCYVCLKYVKEKRHCTTLNKLWADMQRQDDVREKHHCATLYK